MRTLFTLCGVICLCETASANLALTPCNEAIAALHTVAAVRTRSTATADRATWSRIAGHLARLRLAQSEIEELRYDFARDTPLTLGIIETLIQNEIHTECGSIN